MSKIAQILALAMIVTGCQHIPGAQVAEPTPRELSIFFSSLFPVDDVSRFDEGASSDVDALPRKSCRYTLVKWAGDQLDQGSLGVFVGSAGEMMYTRSVLPGTHENRDGSKDTIPIQHLLIAPEGLAVTKYLFSTRYHAGGCTLGNNEFDYFLF